MRNTTIAINCYQFPMNMLTDVSDQAKPYDEDITHVTMDVRKSPYVDTFIKHYDEHEYTIAFNSRD